MKLPCPIQAVVGFDGSNISVVARSHMNSAERFIGTWPNREDQKIHAGKMFSQWFRMRLPVEDSGGPVLATFIVSDPTRFLYTTGWKDLYSRDRVVVLDLRSMMFVLGNLGIFGDDSRHVWGEAVVPSSDPNVLGKKLEEQITAVRSLVSVCGSIRETMLAAREIDKILDGK